MNNTLPEEFPILLRRSDFHHLQASKPYTSYEIGIVVNKASICYKRMYCSLYNLLTLSRSMPSHTVQLLKAFKLWNFSTIKMICSKHTQICRLLYKSVDKVECLWWFCCHFLFYFRQFHLILKKMKDYEWVIIYLQTAYELLEYKFW